MIQDSAEKMGPSPTEAKGQVPTQGGEKRLFWGVINVMGALEAIEFLVTRKISFEIFLAFNVLNIGIFFYQVINSAQSNPMKPSTSIGQLRISGFACSILGLTGLAFYLWAVEGLSTTFRVLMAATLLLAAICNLCDRSLWARIWAATKKDWFAITIAILVVMAFGKYKKTYEDLFLESSKNCNRESEQGTPSKR